MIRLYLLLFVQFFNIGVFSFGGGYATIPFLYDIAQKYNWYSLRQLTDMLAISSITPGPVGVNMATFAGFSTSGILGAAIATSAIVLPSFIFVTIVSKILDKFESNVYAVNVVSALKPAGCALLSAVGIKLLFSSNLHLVGVIILTIFIAASCIKKFDPLFYLGVSAIIGIFMGYLNLIGV